jgi:hypothetical protein
MAKDLEGFWRMLDGGLDAVREVPSDRWDIEKWYDPNPETPGKCYVREGCFLKTVDGFDPAFFGITPREAISMDPMQRLLMEVSWEARTPRELTLMRELELFLRSQRGAFPTFLISEGLPSQSIPHARHRSWRSIWRCRA